jgi:hypothetical protein
MLYHGSTPEVSNTCSFFYAGNFFHKSFSHRRTCSGCHYILATDLSMQTYLVDPVCFRVKTIVTQFIGDI